MNANLKELADQMYDKLQNQKRISELLVMRHAGVDFDTANSICHLVWRKRRTEAKQLLEEHLSR